MIKRNIEDYINILLREITIEDLDKAKDLMDSEEYLENICREYDLQILNDEYSNDFEGI